MSRYSLGLVVGFAAFVTISAAGQESVPRPQPGSEAEEPSPAPIMRVIRAAAVGDLTLEAGKVLGSGSAYGCTGCVSSAYLLPYESGTGTTKLWNTGTSDLIFGTANQERMRIPPTGNVGVVFTRPGDSNYLKILGDAGSTRDMATWWTDGTNHVFAGNMRASTGLTGAFTVWTGGQARMNVLSGGNVGIGTGVPAEKLHVQGNFHVTGNVYAPSGKLMVTESRDNSQGVYITRNPVFEPGSPDQMDYGVFVQATEDVQSGASNGGGLLSAFLKSHLNGPGTMVTATGAHIDVGAATTGGTVLSGVGVKVNFTRAAGSTITTGTGVFVNDVLATTDYAFYQAGADDTNYFAGDLLIGTTSSPSGARLEVAGSANFSGTVTGGNIRAKYQDLAEWVSSNADLAPGTVVVLNPAIGNGVMASHGSYDTAVAGVVSAQPGILLGEAGAEKEQIATTGRVRVRVDATGAPIRVGDLLVTSDKPGLAMRSEPLEIGGRKLHQPGTIIGKALEDLRGGEGEILVLLSLQ